MKNIKEFFQKKDQFAKYIGIELMEAAEGKAKVRLKIKDHHLNGVNMVHGGAIFSLADFAFAVASNSHGTLALGINANISYVKSAKDGILTAEAMEVAKNSKLATYQINITNEKDELIAVFQGTVYRKKEVIDEGK
ncbi:MAG: PaaI family thioesterase [Pseudomonadota bacterium]|nr:PaaI family thioesterase [Pseudomonadota bacterium]